MQKRQPNDFQSKGKQQGDLFEKECQQALELAGFEIVDTLVDFIDAGVEVDIIATNQHAISFYITCKGSIQGDRPGCIRTDTLKKAIAEAYCLTQAGWGPVLLLTSHLPTMGRGVTMLKLVARSVLYDSLVPSQAWRRLSWMAKATELELRQDALLWDAWPFGRSGQ